MPLKPSEAEKLIAAVRELVDAPAAGKLPMAKATHVAADRGRIPDPGDAPAPNGLPLNGDAFEALYRQIKNRFIDDARVDPTLLHLIAAQPELIVEVEPRIVQLDDTNLKGRVALLIYEGFLDAPRATSAIRYELARRGKDPGGGGSLSDNLKSLAGDGIITSESAGWCKAPGLKVTKKTLERT